LLNPSTKDQMRTKGRTCPIDRKKKIKRRDGRGKAFGGMKEPHRGDKSESGGGVKGK